MIDVKQAVTSAVKFAEGLLEPDQRAGLRLEEVEAGKHKGQDAWAITLSMRRPRLLPGSTANLLPDGPRDYKVFTVHGKTGQVLSMKIRELAGVG